MSVKRLAPLAIAAMALLALAGCDGKKTYSSSQPPVTGTATIGSANAKIEIIEFAAPTCPGCKSWHDNVFLKLKPAYIDTGKVRLSIREFKSHNPPVDASIAGIARCVGADQYFNVWEEAFAQQMAIDQASASPTGAKPALVSLAKQFGMDEKKMEACLSDPKLLERLDENQRLGMELGVPGTPTLVMHGKVLPDEAYTWEGLQQVIERELAGAAGPAPAATETPAASPSATPTP